MRTTANEDLLATLHAERAIWRSFVHFFRLVDTLQWERVTRECFTPDAIVEYHTSPDGALLRAHGHAELEAMFVERGKSTTQQLAHVVGQHVIEWEAERPHMTAYVTAWHWFNHHADRGPHRPADWTIIGHLDDDYELADGRWLIARRRVVPVGGLVAAGALP
jgi:hypothetical protein